MNSSPYKTQFPRAVLFDYDGVLVASEPIHLEAWMQLSTELGLPQDPETVRRGVGRTAPEILATLLDLYKPGWTESQYDVHALAQRKNEFYIQFAQQSLRTYPGALEGMKWLRSRQVKIAIVSNGRRRELEKTMSQLGLTEWVDELVSRDDVRAFKPDPTPYLFAAASFGFEVSECLAIEDSPTGLEAALMAKVPAAAVLTNFPQSAVESPVPGRPDLRPVWIGPSLREFFGWLGMVG